MALLNSKIIPTTISNGSSRRPKIVDSTPTKKDAISASIKMQISHILNIFCICLQRSILIYPISNKVKITLLVITSTVKKPNSWTMNAMGNLRRYC